MDVEEAASSSTTQRYLSTMQQQEVDQAFEQLFGYTWGTQFDLDEPQTRRERLLCRILGKRAAATILHTKSQRVVRASVHATKHAPPVAATFRQRPSPPNANHSLPLSASSVRQPSARLASATEPNTAATATKNTRHPPPPPPVGGGGVDSVLQALQEGHGTSTIAKTSADWEVFKDQTGLGDKLEEKAEGKDAFLNRQAFLTRVDHRTFELEKKDRDKERSKRGK